MKLLPAALLATAIMIAVASASANAADSPRRAAPFQRVVDCRAIAANADRLACYDQAVAALDAAERTKQVVIVDKEQMREARHTLFGLPLPNFKLFGGNDDADEVTQIESKVTSASSGIDGWRIRLDDGSVWQQIDQTPMFRTPKPGADIVVKRAALGSFIMRVAGAPGFKVRRVI